MSGVDAGAASVPRGASSPRQRRGRTPLSAFLERLHLTDSGAVAVALAVLGWFVARWLGSRTMYLLVYAGILFIGVAWFVGRRRIALEVRRSDLPARMREGQIGTVDLVVSARRRASTLILQELLDPALGPTVRVPMASIAPGETFEHTYAFAPSRRGVYEIGPTVATWSDPFGLTTQQQHLSEATSIIVHPSTSPVHDRILSRMWEDPPIRPPVSKPWPTGFEFYGMRDYVPGDDLRRVVWAAVAKTGRMLVRESEQGITDRVSIVLDTHSEWHKPGDPSETFETAIRVAASIGARHVKDGLAVTLSTNDSRLAVALRGSQARTTLLDELAKVRLSGTPMEAMGRFLLADARHGSHICIVTPHLDSGMTTRLRMVLERGASVVIVKIVWDESDPRSLARAAGLGCQVVQVPADASIENAFAHQIGAGVRR